MSQENLERRLSDMIAVDLMDFNSVYLSSAGELEISRHFRNDIYLRLGSCLLELSKVTLSETQTGPEAPLDQLPNVYILRKLVPEGQGEPIMFDDDLHQGSKFDLGEAGRFSVMGRTDFVVGTGQNATPGLRLPEDVDEEHLYIRLGSFARNVHFVDLYSSSGTTVYIDKHDRRMAHSDHARAWLTKDGKTVSREYLNRRWTR